MRVKQATNPLRNCHNAKHKSCWIDVYNYSFFNKVSWPSERIAPATMPVAAVARNHWSDLSHNDNTAHSGQQLTTADNSWQQLTTTQTVMLIRGENSKYVQFIVKHTQLVLVTVDNKKYHKFHESWTNHPSVTLTVCDCNCSPPTLFTRIKWGQGSRLWHAS